MEVVKYNKKTFRDEFIIMGQLYRGKSSLYITKDEIILFYALPYKKGEVAECIICSDVCKFNYVYQIVYGITVYYTICNKTECFSTELCKNCFQFRDCSKVKQKITLWLILRSFKFPKDIIKIIIQKMK